MLILDLSNNNAEPNWTQIRQQGIVGVYLKAGEGTSFIDQTFRERRAAANHAGLHVGAYWFAQPDHGPAKAQAQLFAQTVGKIGARDMKPVLDFEAASSKSPAELDAWAREFNQEFKHLTGLVPVFYSYSAYIQNMRPSWPIGSGLWLASYGRNDGTEQPYVVPFPWKRVVAHQFSSKCRITGCQAPVDMSNANSLRPLLAHPVKHAITKAVPYLGRH